MMFIIILWIEDTVSSTIYSKNGYKKLRQTTCDILSKLYVAGVHVI